MAAQAKNPPVGYDDTPMIPGSKWRVHDGKRPQPRVIDPGTPSTLEKPGRPPSDAIVLFDGTDASRWVGRDGGEVGWKVENGEMEVVPRTGSIVSKDEFGDCHLHIEWAAPVEVKGSDVNSVETQAVEERALARRGRSVLRRCPSRWPRSRRADEKVLERHL